jgi:hypothetical protein
MRGTGRSARWARGRIAALSLLVGVLAGCGGGSGAGQSAPRGPSDRIITAELENVHELTAYEAVRRLRPRWLTTRTGSPPMVHIDGNIQMGGVQSLQSLRAADIQEMSYMNAADATTRFGTNYVSGLILVTTKR